MTRSTKSFIYANRVHFLCFILFRSMDSTISLASFSLLFLSLTNFLALPTATRIASAIKPRPRRLYAKLIHHNFSIFSPSYNPNDTVADRANYIVKNSAARLAYLQSKAKTSLASSDDIQAHLDTNTRSFLVKFSIGQPPVPQLGVMDTGSSLTWVECKPCTTMNNCFDPSKSFSYATTSCNDAYCNSLRHKGCDASNHCTFSVTYENLFRTEGVLATEQFTFETFDEGNLAVPNVSFGCSTKSNSRDYSLNLFNGIFGLGNSPTSLVTMQGNKFSYCIGNIADPNYSYNRLVIGDGANIEGYSTPLETYGGFYYVNLEAISIGDVTLNIDPYVFKRTPEGDGGVIIDSGAELSYLPEIEYTELCGKVYDLLDGFLERVLYKQEPWLLCYNGSVNRDLIGFPDVTFHLADGADLVLDTGSLFFYREPQVFCLAVHPIISFEEYPSRNSITVIGVMAQQNYNVAYDLTNKKLHLQRIDCQLLDD